jgi:hypothetical protein
LSQPATAFSAESWCGVKVGMKSQWEGRARSDDSNGPQT